MWEQFKKLIPAKAKSTLGVLIEANIFERPKVILGQPPSYQRVDYTGEINVGLLEATQSEFRPVMNITGSKPMYEGTISESLFRDPALYLLGSSASLKLQFMVKEKEDYMLLLQLNLELDMMKLYTNNQQNIGQKRYLQL